MKIRSNNLAAMLLEFSKILSADISGESAQQSLAGYKDNEILTLYCYIELYS